MDLQPMTINFGSTVETDLSHIEPIPMLVHSGFNEALYKNPDQSVEIIMGI
jgi:hypothetical protein